MALPARGWSLRKKGKKSKLFLVLSPRPWPDCPKASGWYRRLREPISPLSLLKCDQLWQLFSRGWTILLSTVIYGLDSKITAKYSKFQIFFYSMQVSFRFHYLRSLRYLYLWVSAQRFEPGGIHQTEEVSNNFSVSWHITHISMAIFANLGRDTDRDSTKFVFAHPLLPVLQPHFLVQYPLGQKSLEMAHEPRGVSFKLWVKESCRCFLHSPRSHVGDVLWNSEPDSQCQFSHCFWSAFLVFRKIRFCKESDETNHPKHTPEGSSFWPYG